MQLHPSPSPEYRQRAIEVLRPYVSDNKWRLFDECLAQRTRHVTVVLEDIYQPQNASAVLRSCDCFGIQDVHVIENDHAYDINPKVVHGASKWLHVHKYFEEDFNTERCLAKLKDNGYCLVATSPRADSVPVHEFPLDRPIALMMGTEKRGLSDHAFEMADALVTIPMVGFTESLNISVSAAICLQNLTHRLRQSVIPWQLSEEERQDLLLEWMRKVVKDAERIERRFI
ncbi:MAG: RNA methyltransferase [Flavobacteriales bacterium]|nr:RNA methyltransferase [Flavobacteriales bacterium]